MGPNNVIENYAGSVTFILSFLLKYKIVSYRYCLIYFIGIIREERIQLLRSNADTNSYFSGKVPRSITERRNLVSSVADPDPDPKDPYVFGPPGSESGSISQRYGSESGSGSFYHQAEIVRKIMIHSVL